jgi:hypothetical protein
MFVLGDSSHPEDRPRPVGPAPDSQRDECYGFSNKHRDPPPDADFRRPFEARQPSAVLRRSGPNLQEPISDNVLGSLTPALQRGCATNPDAWSPSLMFWRPRRAPARRSANRLLTDVPEI